MTMLKTEIGAKEFYNKCREANLEELEKLFRDYNIFYEKLHQLEKRTECKNENFQKHLDWNCCKEHRETKKRHEELKDRAKKITPIDENRYCKFGHLLDPFYWWKMLGYEIAIQKD